MDGKSSSSKKDQEVTVVVDGLGGGKEGEHKETNCRNCHKAVLGTPYEIIPINVITLLACTLNKYSKSGFIFLEALHMYSNNVTYIVIYMRLVPRACIFVTLLVAYAFSFCAMHQVLQITLQFYVVTTTWFIY